MKRLKYMLLVGLLLSNLTAWGQFDPSNPPEPTTQSHVILVTDPVGSGYFNRTSDFIAEEGEQVYLRAYCNRNYRFLHWEKDGEILSHESGFDYIMGNLDVTLKAKFVFDPSNPPEPVMRHQLFLESDPIGAGEFNYRSGDYFVENERIGLHAYGKNGYQFVHWYISSADGGVEIVSTSEYMNYTIGTKNATLKAKFVFNPTNPEEPSGPDKKYYYIQGSSYSVKQGETVNFPVYLGNTGSVSGLAFNLILKKGITFIKEKVTLGDRCNAHTLQIIDGETPHQYRFVVSGNQSIQGSGGIVLTIPLTVSSEFEPGYYDIPFSNGIVTLPNGIEKELATYSSYFYVNRAPREMGAADYAALCELYREMGGTTWNRSWNIESNLIDDVNWSGVTFSDTHVTRIELNNNGVKGHIPASVLGLSTLTLLDLRDNDLDWNVQQLADMIAKYSVTSAITELNLSGNRLKGDVYALASSFPLLETLNLHSNQFSEVSQPLSDAIKGLDVYNQSVPAEPLIMRLMTNQMLELPTIFTYRHATKNYKPVSSLRLSISQEYSEVYLTYNTDHYTMSWNDWIKPSGTRFVLQSTDGNARGSTIPVIVNFDKGDANADLVIDILDVQQTLNYILKASKRSFVFAAADVYEDLTITVQDIVVIVNLILDSALPQSNGMHSIRSYTAPAARLCIENGMLVVYNDTEVAAADIVLEHCRESQLRKMLNPNQFQIVTKSVGDGTRLVFFSANGQTLPTGRTIIAELSSEKAEVTHATLSDKDAHSISVATVSTGIGSVTVSSISASVIDGKIRLTLPEGIDHLTMDATGIDGRLLYTEVPEISSAGSQWLNVELQAGVYLLRLRVETHGSVLYKIIKVVISK